MKIGVSGHQNLGDEATQQFVQEQIRSLLLAYRERTSDIVLYSALAMGADQLFVRTALALQIPVEIVLPCANYESIFPTDSAREEYLRLLSACQACHRLPHQECSDDAYLALGQWIVDHSDLMILAWNGLPPRGKGGTGDVATYARNNGRPFVHIHTLQHTVRTYGQIASTVRKRSPVSPKQEALVSKEIIYRGSVITLQQYHLCMPDGEEITRDVVERPESLLIVPVSQGLDDRVVLLIEEYDLGAGVWQLKLPGGKIESGTPETLEEQAQRELRQEIGYRAGKIEKLTSFYSHPGYISHKVHIFVAQELEWDPLELERHEEIRVQTSTLREALAATLEEYRCDPESALALWLYAQKERYQSGAK